MEARRPASGLGEFKRADLENEVLAVAGGASPDVRLGANVKSARFTLRRSSGATRERRMPF
jgi:hypothetical protein